MRVERTTPTEAAAGVAWRRFLEAPFLAIPLGLALIAAGFHLARWAGASVTPAPEMGCAAWAAILAGLVRAYLGRRFATLPEAPDDDPLAVRVRWLDAPPGLGSPTSERRAHLLASALRVVGPARWARETAAVAVLAALAFPAMGWFGPLAVAAVAWAFGFPRAVRLAVEVPWDAIERVDREGRNRFRVRRSGGGADLVLEARFGASEVLADRFAERIGGRLRSAGTGLAPEILPAVLRPAEGDEEAGVAELVVRRTRGRATLVAALVCLALSLPLAAAELFLLPRIELRVAAGLLLLGGAVLALIGGAGRVTLRRGGVPAEDDAPDPVPVRWTNRPGGPGPRPQQAHLLPQALRIVGYEWEMWDLLVGGAAYLSAFSAGGFAGLIAVSIALRAAGLPRWRRVAVDLHWHEIVRAEIDGGRFEIRTAVAEPADVVRFEAKFSARARLTSELIERLGDRADVVLPSGGAG